MPSLPLSPPPARPENSIESLVAPLGAMTRRKWLKSALVLTAATGAVYCSPAKKIELPADITNLSQSEFSLFQKVIEVFLPVDQWKMIPTGQTSLLRNIDNLFRHIPAKTRGDLGIGLKLFNYGPIVMGWHFTSFANLSLQDAAAYCEKWQNGNLVQRGVFGALKQIVYMSYWREPVTWGPIGYDGPVSKRNGYARLGNAPLPTSAE